MTYDKFIQQGVCISKRQLPFSKHAHTQVINLHNCSFFTQVVYSRSSAELIDSNVSYGFTFFGGFPFRIKLRGPALTHKLIQAVLDLPIKNSGLALYGL